MGQLAQADQEQFCRGLSSLQLPPPLLDIPWLPSSEGSEPQPGGQSSGAGRGLDRRLLQQGQPLAEAAEGLEAHNARTAQHEAEVYRLASQQGPGPLATLGGEPQRAPIQMPAAAAPALLGSAGGNSTRLKLVPAIRSRLVDGSQFVLSPPFHMYVHANDDIVSGFIAQQGSWEQVETQQLVGALTALAKVRTSFVRVGLADVASAGWCKGSAKERAGMLVSAQARWPSSRSRGARRAAYASCEEARGIVLEVVLALSACLLAATLWLLREQPMPNKSVVGRALVQERGVPKESLIFMDVGANIGAHTVAAAAFGFSVLAFEPMHVNIMSLRHTLCANPELWDRVTLIPTVSQGNGCVTRRAGPACLGAEFRHA